MPDEDVAFFVLASLILAALLVLVILLALPKHPSEPIHENPTCASDMLSGMREFFQVTRQYAEHLRDYVKTSTPTPQQQQSLQTDLDELQAVLATIPHLAPDLKTMFAQYVPLLQALRESRGRSSPKDDEIQSKMNGDILQYVQSRVAGIDKRAWWNTLLGAYNAWYNWTTTFVQGTDIPRYWNEFQTHLDPLVGYLCKV